ncbi:MAG: CHASE2 domain-containing protein [Cyanobacteria bacterium]|jgi:signal transduction histidine kinase|nr:CHASE2 domain-containing protein [Cyanobacteria bacterium GSL.Bin1]
MSQRLKFPKFSVLGIGIGCSLFFSLILSEVSALRHLEFLLRDQLILWQQSTQSPSDQIALVGLRESDLIGVGGEQTRYVALVKRLLEAEAKVVVLNLLDNWVNETSAIENLPLQELIQKYNEQIVLVTPTAPVTSSNITEIETYHHLLPPLVGNRMQSVYDVTAIQGFYEFDNEAPSLEGAARIAHLQSVFDYNDPSLGQTQGKFYSALSLALLKSRQQVSGTPFLKEGTGADRPATVNRDVSTNYFSASELVEYQWPIKIHFFGGIDIFPNFQFEQICLTLKNGSCSEDLKPDIEKQIRGKIVIVGFIAPEQNTKAVLSVQGPGGQPMSGLAVQANILASLMTNRVYRLPPRWVVQLVIIAGAIALSYWINCRFQRHSLRKRQFIALLLLVTLSLYVGFALVFTAQQIVLPVFFPVITWFLTGLIIQGWLMYQAQQELIMQQQYEIAQLKSAESKAIVLQTRKLLHRIASGIHEGPLQDLRLVMDQLELELPREPDFVVNKLSDIGCNIRHYLQNIRSMAEQLEVTPELRQGLVAGIRHHLHQLQGMGKLTLAVQDDLQPLEETLWNSQWLDAREDIFMFFREAMTNVIKHAQPPQGNASQVTILLILEGDYCTLVVQNDAAKAEQPTAQGSLGYGTKMMETVARELPDGHWQAFPLKTGGYRVTLTWHHAVMMTPSTE